MQYVKKGFKTEFKFLIANFLGCVDGSLIPIKVSLIPIQALSSHEDVYICPKGYPALKV